MSINFMRSIHEAVMNDSNKAKGFTGIREGLLPENDKEKTADAGNPEKDSEVDNDPEKSECDKWESLFHSRINESVDGKKGETDDSTVGTGSESPADDKTKLPGGTGDASKGTVSGNPADPNNSGDATKEPENPMADLKESLVLKHFDEAITDAAKIKVGKIYVIDGQEYAFITMKANGKIAAKVMRMSEIPLEKLASTPMSEFTKHASEIVLPEAEFMAYNISGRVDLANKSIVAEAKMKKFFEALDPQASLANLAMEYPEDPKNEPHEPESTPADEDTPLAGSVLKAMAGAEKGNTANAGTAGTDQGASSTDPNDKGTTTKTTESKKKDECGDWWNKLSEEDKEKAMKLFTKECDSKK